MNPAEFATRLAEWQPFSAALAGASATFAGLLFVSLSVNTVLLQGKDAGADLLARHTFSCFIYLVLTALVMMLPRQGPFGIGLARFGMGLGALLQTLQARRQAAATPSTRVKDRAFYHLSTATYLTLIGVALSMIYGYEQALYALAAVMLWQLVWATRLAWDLLMVRE